MKGLAEVIFKILFSFYDLIYVKRGKEEKNACCYKPLYLIYFDLLKRDIVGFMYLLFFLAKLII